MSTKDKLRLRAINRYRKELFGEEPLKLFETTPETGETQFGDLEVDWRGFKTVKTTDGSVAEAGAWQFEIKAEAGWQTSQADMFRIVAVAVGSRRWKVTKVEKPAGGSLVWKLKATSQ